ncbi:TIGR02452 family protein [Flavivirga amylovorans]|uniref:TIGR02452 family protein n=1 Tax=Flavivirga amylovorans TaxID=870486 RepID=A0ABT8WZJ2_9FLAO|nr:TIGR02452 family protein [Flavivirga amylovorans]MDO5987101.1 TIGR02452 family protein [Flavivirga amylovorans]
MKKSTRKIKAEETLQIIEEGIYTNSNKNINIKDRVKYTLENTKYYSSNDLEELSKTVELKLEQNTQIEITGEDSISCILRLSQEGETNIMCLNFASAKNPGGGFLNGALAQEESLAVSSALYGCQLNTFEFYETHRNMKSCIYTDSMIYSPKVPVFRNKKGELQDKAVEVNFITSAAINAGVVRRKEPHLTDSISNLMEQRIEKLLTLCVKQNQQVLILGAWGCGVFQNDPDTIASIFYNQLTEKFKGQFKRVVFAIYSRNDKFIEAFLNAFNK